MIITVYYKLKEKWMWADLIIRLNEHEIRIHLSGEHNVANASKFLELRSPIRIELTTINALADGIIYGNSTIMFIRVEAASQGSSIIPVVVAIEVMIVPVIIQLIRRIRESF